MSAELTSEQAARLLRAKAGELEQAVLDEAHQGDGLGDLGQLRADIALVATLLADYIERTRDGRS